MKNLFNLFNKAVKVAENLNKMSDLPKILGGAKTISIDQIPTSTIAFMQLRDRLAQSPEGGAAVLLIAAIQYTENPELGRHWMIIATDKKWLSRSNQSRAYKEFDLGSSANFSLTQTEGKKYIPYSYIKGSSAANGYQPGNTPWQIAIERSTDGGDGTVKVYVQSSGADAARPVTMKRNDAGIWKAVEYSSIFTGIQPPASVSGGETEGDF